MDAFPITADKAPEPKPAIWRFKLNSNPEVITFLVGDDCDTPSRSVDLNHNQIPLLACFDLEYWPQHEIISPDEKQQFLIIYLQTLRATIVEKLFNTESHKLLDKAWTLDDAHPWATRTWNNCGHSPRARSLYLRACKEARIVPYQEPITTHRGSRSCSTHMSHLLTCICVG
jgi:hypothetical protein